MKIQLGIIGTISATACLTWMGLEVISLGQDFVDGEKKDEEKLTLEESLGRFFEAQDRRRVKVPHEKSHRNTLSEYNPVVERARESTVKVYKGDYVKALGTIVAREGLIISKASEIEDDTELAVELPNKEKKVAELVEINEENDLALLWVHDFNLQPVTWAPGKDLPVGSLVAASGSLRMPLAIGAVSLPLRNLSESNKGFLGITIRAAEDESGLTVTEVVAKSGAESAGIEIGDLIQAIDGQPMKTNHDLINTISQAEPGDIVVAQLRRRDEALILEVTLGDRDSGLGFAMPMHELLDNTARMGGRVSRKRSGYLAAIQHDLLLKPNQCGGPLVNLDGDVIGVNIARASRVKSYAIPSEVIQEWLGDPRILARIVLQARVRNAEAARLAAEEALQRAIDLEAEVRNALEELEERRASQVEGSGLKQDLVPATLKNGQTPPSENETPPPPSEGETPPSKGKTPPTEDESPPSEDVPRGIK